MMIGLVSVGFVASPVGAQILGTVFSVWAIPAP